MVPSFHVEANTKSKSAGIDWVILTNGTNWKVFKIIFGKPVMNELIYEFDFLNLNPKKASDVELLYYVSKESLGKSVLEDFRIQMQALSKFFVGQILLTEPVLDAIKKTIKKICPEFKATPEDIRDVLMLEGCIEIKETPNSYSEFFF